MRLDKGCVVSASTSHVPVHVAVNDYDHVYVFVSVNAGPPRFLSLWIEARASAPRLANSPLME
jgi:hypothetical protein